MTEAMHMHRVFDEVEAGDIVTDVQLDKCLDVLGLARGDSGGAVTITGADPAVDSPHRLGGAMAVAAAAQGTGLAALWREQGHAGQNVSVDIRRASHAVHPSRYLKQQGYPIGFDFTFNEPGNGYFRTKDGRWVYLVSTRPHLKNDLLALLGCANEIGAISSAVLKWNGQELEDVCIDLGLPVSLVRSPQEWRAHPHAQALARRPVIDIEKIGVGSPKLWLTGMRPLSGLKVLDLSHILAGPGLSRTLAEQGADVLRISAPRQTDPLNFMLDTGFGKRAAFLDFDSNQDIEKVRCLIREADVVVQSYSPGSLARRGLSIERMMEGHPGLVCVELSCYGDCGGPWSNRVGFDHNSQSTTGISWVEGGADSPRLPPTTLVADYITAYLGTAGVLAALLRRAREGGSYHVKVALARTCMWIQDMGLINQRGIVNTLEPATLKMDSPFGELEYLAPITAFSATPAYWTSPPQPLGASPAQWADSEAHK